MAVCSSYAEIAGVRVASDSLIPALETSATSEKRSTFWRKLFRHPKKMEEWRICVRRVDFRS